MDANRNIDLTKDDCPISYDNEKQLVEFNPTFTTELNQQLQDSVHALDGYYLFDATNISNDFYSINPWVKFLSDNDRSLLSSFFESHPTVICPKDMANANGSSSSSFYLHGFGNADFLYASGDRIYRYSKKAESCDGFRFYVNRNKETSSCSLTSFMIGNTSSFLEVVSTKYFVFGAPFKLFYSEKDLENFLNKGRTYVPQLPSVGFKVNIKYINNSVNYPDVNVNLDSFVGKVEADVQADLDLTLKNYLDHLADFTDGGGTTNPTPTPSGGSGGDFGDGTTPTPTPDFTDGSLTDTNTLLQKILDKLTEFSTNHDKLAKTITDYIQKNDGKLEEILLAIQALSDGKTETEQNGCKYDFTALSEYLTKLWNDSDKKFDEMVKLLEENNKYQQKLVDSLNEIKALLIADTVMDFFKDRSRETAEKAKDKFPTSIPWDISLVLNSMSAEPKNPKFSLPIKIESFKINETIDIDLSTDEWEKLAKTCRYILSVTFILFLIHLSRKLFSNGGDD